MRRRGKRIRKYRGGRGSRRGGVEREGGRGGEGGGKWVAAVSQGTRLQCPMDSASSATSQSPNLKSHWIFGKWLLCRASATLSVTLARRETLPPLSGSAGLGLGQMDAVG